MLVCLATAISLIFYPTLLISPPLPLYLQKHALVYLLHLDSQELVQYKTEDKYEPLPKSGVLW